jgi:hypothetical protein
LRADAGADSGIMESSSYVTGASLILGAAEFGFIASLASRDRMLYRCVGGCLSDKEADVLTLMKEKKLLRVRNAHMETVLEVHLRRRSPRP